MTNNNIETQTRSEICTVLKLQNKLQRTVQKIFAKYAEQTTVVQNL